MLRKSFYLFLLIVSIVFVLVSCKGDKDEVQSNESGAENAGNHETDGVISDENNDESGSTDDTENSESDETDKSENEDETDKTKEDQEQDGEDEVQDNTSVTFVYSVNSKKYHLPTCYHISSMNEETKVEFVGTMEELVENGFIPCKSCKPDPDYDYDAAEEDSTDEEVYNYKYVINSNSKVFHLPGCSSIGSMNEENKQYSNESREELILQEYLPCKNCKP